MSGDVDDMELDIQFKQAVILLSKSVPWLIDEMKLLRGAIGRIPPPRRY